MDHSQHSNPQPLSGIRVVDFTQAVFGPIATQTLGDYGADVIKIERPGNGDLSRWSAQGDQNNPMYQSVNRNKRSIALDLRSEQGKQVVLDLIRCSDVVVNNFRAGTMERMGFGYAAIRAENPRIVYANGTGFGRVGPFAYKGGQDVLAQAMSGVMARRPDPAMPISVYATCLCDYTAGMHLVQAILLALRQRDLTGAGQEVHVSLFESMIAMQAQETAVWLQDGKDLNWGAMPLTGAFETSDGALVLVGAFKAEPLRDICKALDLGDLWQDHRFATHEQRVANRAALQALFAERFKTNTTTYWLGRLDEQDLLCAPVLTLAQALAHEQTAVNGSLIISDSQVPVLGSPLGLREGAFQLRNSPPALGADGESILEELGYSAGDIESLKQSKVMS